MGRKFSHSASLPSRLCLHLLIFYRIFLILNVRVLKSLASKNSALKLQKKKKFSMKRRKNFVNIFPSKTKKVLSQQTCLQTSCIIISFNEHKFPPKALFNLTSDDEKSLENQLESIYNFHLAGNNRSLKIGLDEISFFEY